MYSRKRTVTIQVKNAIAALLGAGLERSDFSATSPTNQYGEYQSVVIKLKKFRETDSRVIANADKLVAAGFWAHFYSWTNSKTGEYRVGFTSIKTCGEHYFGDTPRLTKHNCDNSNRRAQFGETK